MGVANVLGELPFDLQNEESGFRCFNTIFSNNILDTLELMELDGQEEGVFLKGDAAQRSSSNPGMCPAIPERIQKRRLGSQLERGGPGTAHSLQDFHSQVAGWGPRKHPLGRTQRQQKGVRAHQEPMKAVFDSGARLAQVALFIQCCSTLHRKSTAGL